MTGLRGASPDTVKVPAPDHPVGEPPKASGRAALPAWRALQAHAAQMQDVTLQELFDTDPHRLRDFAFDALGFYADFSKHRVTHETMRLLSDLSRQYGLWEQIVEMFAGVEINGSEHHATLHTALRAPRGAVIRLEGENVVSKIHQVLDRMAAFALTVRHGQWVGHTGKPIQAVVNIGIGGSDLGPRMAHQALHTFSDRALQMEFVSNVDGAEFTETTRGLDPATTLFVVSSKSWHTRETLTNAHTTRDWTLAAFGGDTAAISRHFVTVSTNAEGVHDFGIDPENTFPLWDWVGVRYPFDAAVGLSLMIAVGPENFTQMLSGMHAVDEHFRTTPLECNIPTLMGLLSICYNNFLGAQTHAVLPTATT